MSGSTTRNHLIDRRRRELLGALPGLALLALNARAAAPDATIDVPTVDRLTLHIVVDAQTFAFAEPIRRPDLVVERVGPRGNDTGPPDSTLTAEFGFSILAESRRGDATRRVLVDAGYTPAALANNLSLLGLDPATFDLREERIRDFLRFPELRWLETWHWVAP